MRNNRKPLNKEQMTVALRELGFDFDPDEAVAQYSNGQA